MDCGTPFYLDPKVAACSVIEKDEGIVLIRRGIPPQKGRWVIPGGFVDRGEPVEAAAVRESLEECGLETRITGLLGVYSYPGEIVVVVIYKAEALGGILIAGDETTEAGVFSPDRIPWAELAFESTRQALMDYGLEPPGQQGESHS
jgi:ADP-ribose pyrophosphatase YjhB (NUDIX family)